jgi:hypothetical protein
MSITENSGIYFFTDSKCLGRDGASCVASSGTLSQDYILNFNKAFVWQSSGSDDTTTETLTITFPSTQTINSLFLINHNFKKFKITYNSGNNFTNVKTANIYDIGAFADEDGAIFTDNDSNYFTDGEDDFSTTTQEIYFEDYNKNTAYFEFDSVSVSTIEITIYTTQTADAEKTLNIFSAQEIIGNFSNSGLDQNNPNINYNEKQYNNILNKPFIRKGIETFSCSIRVPYAFTQADVDLIETLQDREEPFMVWLCGGKQGNNYFRVNAKPYRLEDVYRVQNVRNSSPSFNQNIYVTGYNNSLNVVEVA